MNVKELINYLEDYNPEAEVQIAIQPSWPLALPLGEVLGNPPKYDEETDTQSFDDCDKIVWLVEGAGLLDYPYAPKSLFD